MGRKLYRVPLDFDWPRNKTWKGYINPFWQLSQGCAACGETGHNPETWLISELFYAHDQRLVRQISQGIVLTEQNEAFVTSLVMNIRGWIRWCEHITQDEVEELVQKGRLAPWTRVYTPGEGWKPKDPPYMPTAEEINAANCYTSGRYNAMDRHDGINRGLLIEFRAKKFGVWGSCLHCSGDGRIWPEGVKELYENWTKTKPPQGEGFQLWQTTSEGSPISPVFESLEALCAWCAENATTFASFKATAEEWFEMLSEDFVAHREGNAIFM